MLEFGTRRNTWRPPRVNLRVITKLLYKNYEPKANTRMLYIFHLESYIDAVYVCFGSFGKPERVKRFTFHEGYVWNEKDERFFHEHCIKECDCSFQGGALDYIYEEYCKSKPAWHLQRYYTKGLRLLDHIYHCMKQNTAKELLYKSGLDELAAHLDKLDELNLLAKSPSDIYDGISAKILRQLNCPSGAILLSKAENRAYIKRLNRKYPQIFREKLNDAQCEYIIYLIGGNLTVNETGRLFEARKRDLAPMWIKSQFNSFLLRDKKTQSLREKVNALTRIDPIYAELNGDTDGFDIYDLPNRIHYYLIEKRDEFDHDIRVSNRKRPYDWQERNKDFIVRYPQTINDFCREAVYMHSCLISYIEAYAHNDTTILYMRKADDVNKPFITIEIYEGELTQAFHRFNRKCNQEEAAWIEAYCKRHGIKRGTFRFDLAFENMGWN